MPPSDLTCASEAETRGAAASGASTGPGRASHRRGSAGAMPFPEPGARRRGFPAPFYSRRRAARRVHASAHPHPAPPWETRAGPRQGTLAAARRGALSPPPASASRLGPGGLASPPPPHAGRAPRAHRVLLVPAKVWAPSWGREGGRRSAASRRVRARSGRAHRRLRCSGRGKARGAAPSGRASAPRAPLQREPGGHALPPLPRARPGARKVGPRSSRLDGPRGPRREGGNPRSRPGKWGRLGEGQRRAAWRARRGPHPEGAGREGGIRPEQGAQGSGGEGQGQSPRGNEGRPEPLSPVQTGVSKCPRRRVDGACAMSSIRPGPPAGAANQRAWSCFLLMPGVCAASVSPRKCPRIPHCPSFRVLSARHVLSAVGSQVGHSPLR